MPSEQDRARGLIEDSLKDKNPDTRKHAVQALGLVSPREPYLSELEAMLDDKDVEVRLATITSLMDLKNERTVAALRKALDSDVPEVSFAAAKALWTLNDPVGHEALLAVLGGETKTSSGSSPGRSEKRCGCCIRPRRCFCLRCSRARTSPQSRVWVQVFLPCKESSPIKTLRAERRLLFSWALTQIRRC